MAVENQHHAVNDVSSGYDNINDFLTKSNEFNWSRKRNQLTTMDNKSGDGNDSSAAADQSRAVDDEDPFMTVSPFRIRQQQKFPKPRVQSSSNHCIPHEKAPSASLCIHLNLQALLISICLSHQTLTLSLSIACSFVYVFISLSIKAQELASAILSSSSPLHISSACSAIETFLHKHVPDQTRSFFAVAFPVLICKIFGFDDSSASPQKSHSSGGWIDQIHVSHDAALAGKLYELLSPSGILLSSIFAVDRHSLVKYVFPVERLPQWARFVLQSERDPSILPNLCPLFRGRLKEDPVQGAFQVQLNVFEYYMFWFAYYPVCKGNWCALNGTVVRKSRGFRLESWTSSFPVLANATSVPGQKIECNLYLRLLYAYLRSFVPNYGLNSYQPYRSSLLHYSSAKDSSALLQAEFLVYTLIHFWLAENDFSPLPLNVCHSFNMSISCRKVLGEASPTAGLGEPVRLLLKYLNASVVLGKEGVGTLQNNAAQKLRFLGSAEAVKSRIDISLFPYGSSFGSWNILIQRPFYRFILRTFLYCPIGNSIKDAFQIFSVWVAYLEPWKINLEEFAEFDALEPVSLRGESGQSLMKARTVDGVYQSQYWQDYVESNYLFYNSLIVHFLGFAHKFLHNNVETIIQMVLKVCPSLVILYCFYFSPA
ncbi:hypothetical protein ACLOJK_041727 [Asimina triloba]